MRLTIEFNDLKVPEIPLDRLVEVIESHLESSLDDLVSTWWDGLASDDEWAASTQHVAVE